jgi:hypothetical protein
MALDTDPFLTPGKRHPNHPLAPEDLADRLSVATRDVLQWLKEGMPVERGLIDPFVAANWLCWTGLGRCPVLERRWRQYLRWFHPHVVGDDAPRRYRVRQVHRLYLPQAVAALHWYLPKIPLTSEQVHADEREPLRSQDGSARATDAGPFVHLAWTHPPLVPEALGTTEVTVNPRPLDLFPDHRELVDLVVELVAEFRYEYRHHQPAEGRRRTLPLGPGNELIGNCLDCALELGRRLDERGRPWKLCVGLVAHDALANPHFWLKVDTTAGWVPVDPSLPAIARMLGDDWKAYVDAYVGACDARRITISEGDRHIPAVPGGPSVGSTLGEAIAMDEAGSRQNAWPCLDWVCGECSWRFPR